MYWCTSKSGADCLVRANLDGSNATVVSSGYRKLYGITLGQPSNDLLYWVDQAANKIGSVDVDGGNKRAIVKLKANPAPFGVQVVLTRLIPAIITGKMLKAWTDILAKS